MKFSLKGIIGRFRNKKLFIATKEELTNLSETERALVAKHRDDLVKYAEMQKFATDSMNSILNISMDEEEGSKPVYLYDFVSEWHSSSVNNIALNHNVIESTVIFGDPQLPTILAETELEFKNKRSIKPIDVWHELEDVPNLMSMENLDDKILVLKKKKDLIKNNHYAQKEMIDMVCRLENRKRYDEFKEFYDEFDNTTSEKVMALVEKYKLVLEKSDLFIAQFPAEAIEIMSSYVDTTKKLCGKTPIFYVIAEKEMFKKAYEKNDPILLVQSPFGAYWQVLGAWDKELVLLSEL